MNADNSAPSGPRGVAAVRAELRASTRPTRAQVLRYAGATLVFLLLAVALIAGADTLSAAFMTHTLIHGH